MKNSPSLWQHALPRPDAGSHKYTRGHALVMGGGIGTTGAARLAAVAALRMGAGLVSIACDRESLPVYAASLLAVMTKPIANLRAMKTLLADEHITAVLIGPGYGTGKRTRAQVKRILARQKPCVLDADALSAFSGNSGTLFSAIKSPVVMTPHEGEFARIFSLKGDRVERAKAAASLSGAVIVLKGHETIIASPGGEIVSNDNAPAWLATAGSGDVLAGMIAGLLAQGMPAFEAACAAVWIHGAAASAFGPGLISEDLPTLIPPVLGALFPKEQSL